MMSVAKLKIPVIGIALCAALFSGALCSRRPARPTQSRLVRDEIKGLLEWPTSGTRAPRARPVHVYSHLTHGFYELRDFHPAWSAEGDPLPQAESLGRALQDARLEGLSPGDYHLDEIRGLMFQARGNAKAAERASPGLLARLDVLLTDAYLLLASHLVAGRVNPVTGSAEWNCVRDSDGLLSLLAAALATDQVRASLLSLRPQHDYYFVLRRALAEYRCELSRLERPERASLPGTLRSERYVLEKRIEMLLLNMERWRWLPRQLGRRFILVDIASFELHVVEEGRVRMSMKVVVGNQAWQTPVFSAEVTGVVLNPAWNATANVFFRELINYIKADKNYLTTNKMKILYGWGSKEEEIDPASVDWTTLDRKAFPELHLRQEPGPLNVLGRLKFNMPNRYDVYLHDTPYQEDFKREERIFSHGCIRAERPVELAVFLVRSPLWTPDRIRAAIDENGEKTIGLGEPVPIHVNYCTAWAGEDGRLEFRGDVYGRDSRLGAALKTTPPIMD